MANLLLRIVLVVALLIALVSLVGTLLPRDYDFESRVEVNASPAEIFPLINQIRNWQRWSMWNPERIENLDIQYRGNPAGVGAEQVWIDVRGKGELKIIESEPNRRIKYRLNFGDFQKMESTIELVPEGDTTRVVWRSAGRLPAGPFYGYFRPLFSRGMKDQYDQALAELKRIAEEAE